MATKLNAGKIILYLIIGYVVSFVLPFYINVLVILISAKILWDNYGKKKLFIITGLLIGLSIRLLISFSTLVILYKSPHYLTLKPNHPWKFFLLLGSDLGIYEKITGHYTDTLVKGDPFSNQPLKERDGEIYSVGPDGFDNYLEIIYNPTNGTISPGDIIVPTSRQRAIQRPLTKPLAKAGYKVIIYEQLNDLCYLFVIASQPTYWDPEILFRIGNIFHCQYEYAVREKVIELKRKAWNAHPDKLLEVQDPFSSSTLKKTNGLIYSIGPDLKDNQTLIAYDPTNGIISPGDIIVPTSRQRAIQGTIIKPLQKSEEQ